VTFAAGIFAQVRIASFSATAIVAAFTGIASWTLVLMHRRVPASAGRLIAVFTAFLLVCTASAVLGTVTRQGIQYIQVLFAALGAMALGAIVRARVGESLDDVIARCMRISSMVLIAAFAASGAGAHVDVAPRTSAIVALIGIGWFLAEHRAGRKRALWWALALLTAIAVSLSRSALVAGFILVAGTMIVASPRRRLRTFVFGVLLISAGYWAITSWAPLHDRFFSGDLSLSVGGVTVNAEGRTYVWDVLWSEVPNDLLLGHGPGAASARSVALDPAFDQPHNDYLRIIYDYGLVGSALVVWFGLCVARLLKRAMRSGSPSIAPLAARTAGLAILIVMITDNPLDYPFVMIPLGALVGLGLGAGASRVSHSLLEPPTTEGVGYPVSQDM
jgi:O-antigen ligase